MAHNWKWYVEHDDLLGCYKRYEQARSNWKEHWWATVETIYNNSVEWAQGYFLDKVNKVLVFVKEISRKVKETFCKKPHLCYWVRLIGESGTVLYNKIGTTEEGVQARMKKILKNQYQDGLEKITDYEIMKVWDCGDKAPEGLESFLRAMLIKKYDSENFVKNDRFLIGNIFSEPTFEEMNNWAISYLN